MCVSVCMFVCVCFCECHACVLLCVCVYIYIYIYIYVCLCFCVCLLGPVTGLAPCLAPTALSGKHRARCLCVGQCSGMICGVVAPVSRCGRRSRESVTNVRVLVFANKYKEET